MEIEFSAEAGLMASDGFHPGPGAYAEWGRHIADNFRKIKASNEPRETLLEK